MGGLVLWQLTRKAISAKETETAANVSLVNSSAEDSPERFSGRGARSHGSDLIDAWEPCKSKKMMKRQGGAVYSSGGSGLNHPQGGAP